MLLCLVAALLTALPADVRFSEWCLRNKIFSSPHVGAITTTKSVACRGLFTLSEGVKRNDVLAVIPRGLVLTSADGKDWAGDIASKAKEAEGKIAEWVETWEGGYKEEMAARAPENVREHLKRKVERRHVRWIESRKKYPGLDEADFGLYNVVWSRACYLGEVWNNEIGVVPFFDMLNHGGREDENVRLCPVGEARAKMGNDMGEVSNKVPPELDDRDMLLIATKDIPPESELFTCYINENERAQGIERDEELARRLMTWGF
mmetsp:Transcript_8515/g.17068  ORF Transcript_8515/g.17068 Transcript_8515/m.17068 type:complete len:262 (-) Transcript_8515:23-808(-)